MPSRRKLAALALAAAAGYLLEASRHLKEENNAIRRFRRRKQRRCWVKKRLQSDVYEDYENQEPHYLTHFHLGPADFEVLLERVAKDITKRDTPMRKAYSARAKLEATLRFLATGESYRRLEAITNLSAPFLSSNIPIICGAIFKNLRNDYFKFPKTTTGWLEVSEYFQESYKFPLCLGAVCEKRILFRPLRMDEKWKKDQYISVLAVANSMHNIIYVEIDCNGQDIEGSLFERSRLKKTLESPDLNFPANTNLGDQLNMPYIFVGGGNIPLHERVIVPYTSEEDDKTKQVFNARVNEIIDVVEKSFALLTRYFKIMQTLNVKKEQIPSIILACFSLHNFLLTDAYHYEDKIYHLNLDCDTPKPARSLKFDLDPKAEEIRAAFAEYFSKEH